MITTLEKSELQTLKINAIDSTSVGLNPSVAPSGIMEELQEPLNLKTLSRSSSPALEANLVSTTGEIRKFSQPRLWVNAFGYNSPSWRVDKHPRIMTDVNGDGKADIVGFGDAGPYVSISTGNGFTRPRLWSTAFGYNDGWRVDQHPRIMADVNGDGKADIVGFGWAGAYVSTSTGNGFTRPRLWVNAFGYNGSWRTDKHPRIMADVNGDGKADIVGFGWAGAYVSTSTGNGFTRPRLWVNAFGYNSPSWRVDKHPRIMADVNGDGKADIVGFGDAGPYVSTSTGNGFTRPRLWSTAFGYNDGWRVDKHPRIMTDVNGDGKADIVGFGWAGAYVSTSMSFNDWIGQNLRDPGVTRLTRQYALDGYLSRNETIAILRDTKDDGSVSSTELTDLRRLVGGARYFSLMRDYVYNLSYKVVYSDPANQWWTGGAATHQTLGDLRAGSSDAHMEKLIGKWFLGKDLPVANTSYQFVNGSLFGEGINASDIKQGSSARDCYFLATLASAAVDKPYVIQNPPFNMFIDNGDGTFTVRFYRKSGGRYWPEYVTVNKQLPTRGGKAVYAGWGGGDHSNSNNKLWVALAEKAYAQVNESGWLKKGEDHNSYLKDKGIGSNFGNPNTARKASEAMEHIMGFDAKIEDKDDINAGSFTKNDLIQLVNSDNLVSVELGPHHYAIIGYDSSTKKFNLYDPFGSYQHKTWDELVASLRNGFQYTIT